MREDNKRWLISKMKTSGSKRDHLVNGSYADQRNVKTDIEFEDLPTHESVKQTVKFLNGKINYGLLVRFLRGNIGNDWDLVHSEILARIPVKLMDYKYVIFWFVADKVEIVNGKPWNKKTQQFIWTKGEFASPHFDNLKQSPELREFYVEPETNVLIHVPQLNFKKVFTR